MSSNDEEKLFVDHEGEVSEFTASDSKERRKHVRFPVCLAVRYGEVLSSVCADFVLNASRGGVFIKTESLLLPGSVIQMHFYIPPEEKLLGEFTGRVVAVNLINPAYPRGMHVEFTERGTKDMDRLIEYLEEKRHLVDEEA